MELWIRSQDKTCIKKASAIWISCEPEIPEYYIEVDTDVLGRYKTKERALEVLNKISKLVENAMYHTQLNDEVLFYQMPEK